MTITSRASILARASILLALLAIAQAAPAAAQAPTRLTPPYLESHSGPMLLTFAGSTAGILGLSAAIHIRNDDSANEKRGTLALTLPLAWTAAVGGAAATRFNDFATLGSFVAGGLMGGALGHRLGTAADSTGRDGLIDAMTVVSWVGAALIVTAAVLPMGN